MIKRTTRWRTLAKRRTRKSNRSRFFQSCVKLQHYRTRRHPEKLRAAGFTFAAQRARGYRLTGRPPTLHAALIEAQLKGRTFPENGSGNVAVTINHAELAASGDRLLISLRVKAREKASWFGFGADATIHVWGRPVLDRERQMLRLNDIVLDVESEAAFGLLGAAARAAVPYLERTVADNAVVDLAPFTANARKSIEAALSDFRKSPDGVRVDAAITDLRLMGIEFDSTTLRVIAEAAGTINVSITALPGL